MLTDPPAHDRFEVERSVGAGGMGAVYRAIDRQSGLPVALKIALDDRDEYRTRALAEAGALAALDHPAIVRLVASGIGPDGRPFLAMEWLDGEDLGKRLERGPISLAESLLLGVRLAEGLEAAHSVGIVHRDLKPSNIFLPGGAIGRAKLVDFGIARVGTRRLTASGVVLGTPGYMAPEQAMGRDEIGWPVDVFALGAVLYEAILGEAAFPGAHAVAVLAKVLFEEVPALESRREGIPSALSELVSQMLAKAPAQRPRVADIAKSLSDLLPMINETAHAHTQAISIAASNDVQANESELALSDDLQLVCVLVAKIGAVVADARDEVFPDHATAPSLIPPAASDPLERLRMVVAPLGGRAERLLDGTLIASWTGTGVPRDLAARAARAALVARERLPGCIVALGSGLVSSDSQLRFGAALDRAADLLGKGAASGVCIDDITAGLLDDRFHVEAASNGHLLVGRRTLDSGPRRRLAGKTTPCVGRERELRMLGDLLDECIDAARVSIAVVTAPPGIGKSRLCRELLRVVRLREGVEVWSAEADEMGVGSPFALVGAVIQSAIGVKPSDSLDERREKLTERVARTLPEKEQARVAAMLGEIASIPFPTSAHPLLAAARHEPSVMAEQVRRAFIDWVAAETETNAVLLVFEDLHWGDVPSVKLVTAALNALRDKPLMLLGFARPEVCGRFPELWAQRELQEIRLGGLTKRAAAKLVQQVLPNADAALVQRLVDRADGNTLYLEELVRAAAAGRGDNLPETVAAMVQARFLELPHEERRVVRAASVFGGAFWFGAIAWILGGRANATTGVKQSIFDSLVEHEILERRVDCGFPGDQEYVFRHALLREGAYALLTEADRAACHLRAAEWLENQALVREREMVVTGDGASKNAERSDWRGRSSETGPERIAYHYELGKATDRAVQWYAQAAAKALRAGDPGGAASAAERGLTLFATLPEAAVRTALELDLRISHFQGLMLTGGYTIPEAVESLHRARDICSPGAPQRYTVIHGLWMRHLAAGDVWEARAFAAEMLALVEGKPSAKIVAHQLLGMTCVFLGEHNDACANLEAALRLFDRQAHPEASLTMGADIEVFASCYLAMTYWALGKLDQGISLLKRSLDLAEEIGHPYTQAVANSFAALHYQARRERAPTLKYAKRTHELAAKYGFMHYTIQSQVLLGWASFAPDRATDALGEMESAIAMRRARGGLVAVPHLMSMLVDAKLSAGLADDALRALDDAIAIMNKTGERVFASEIHRLMAEAYMARGKHGDIDRAEDALLCACEVAHYQNSRVQELRAATSLARLWRKVGNGREGWQKLGSVLSRFSEGFDTLDVREARALLAEEYEG